MIISKITGQKLKNLNGLATHLKKTGMSVLEYYIKYEGFEIPKCTQCNGNAKLRKALNFLKTCGDSDCKKKIYKSRKLSENHKEKIKKARVKYLNDKNNFEKTAWGKSARGIMTYGEEVLHNIFIENKIYEKYDVVSQYCLSPYFIDFAFINEKIAVEFDGKCHFVNGKDRIEHDIKRDLYLNNMGWNVYRVPYYDLATFSVVDLINFIGNPVTKTLNDRLEKYKDYKLNNSNFISKSLFNKLERQKKESKYIDIILESDINFKKMGWVAKVATIINQKPQKVNKWMKKYMPNFYSDNCFKRKSRT